MKKLFNAIRHNDIALVKEIIGKNPQLVNCVAKQPPKKDDGQSPLQVALKTGAMDIAEFLLDANADVNFMEDESCCNKWRMPVLQDAVMNAVNNCRWNSNSPYLGYRIFSTCEKAKQACDILERMLKMGADLNKADSFGSNTIWRFCLAAHQILPNYNFREGCEYGARTFTKELEADLSRVLDVLIRYGADINYISPNDDKTIKERYYYGSLAKLLSKY